MEAKQRTDQIHPQKEEGTSLLDIHARIRRLSLQHAEDLQAAFAESLTTAAVRAYWESQQAHHGVSFPLPEPPNAYRPPLTDQTQELAAQLGKVLASLPVLDAAYHIGLVYTTSLPPAYRARNGVYYTPPALANRLLDQADAAGVDWKTARIIDPACGGSAFLVPAALRLLDALRGTDPAIAQQNLKARLHGWEIDAFAAWLSGVFVEIACLPLSAATGHLVDPTIVAHDSLQAEIPVDGYDLIVGNPPFGRVRLPGQLRQRFTRSLYGHANMYGVFTDLAVQLARPGGLVSFLTPASFLAGEYFKNLRALLWKEAPPAFVDLVESRRDVFEGVLQETVLATYRRGGRRRQASVSLVHPLPGGMVTIESAGRFALPSVCSEPWILPRSTRDKPLSRSMRSMPHRLADWGYKVSTGPLVWNRHKDQLRNEAGKGCVPLIWAESVTADGRFEFRCEKRNHKPYFYLRPAKDDWLRVDQPCVLLQRTTAKEQHRRLIAAAMPEQFLSKHAAVTVENHLNMLIPMAERPAVSPQVLAAFLNSKIADRAFRCISGSVAVSAYELESLPLPPPKALAPVARLLAQNGGRGAIEDTLSNLYREGS